MSYQIGEKAQVSKTISETDVYLFAGISGDFNPLHLDSIEAKNSIFGRRVAHGFLVGSLISNIIGTKLPGAKTIYIEQNMRFIKPVYIGDTVTACVKVVEIIREDKNILKLETIVENQDKDIVIDGFAIVKAPDTENRYK